MKESHFLPVRLSLRVLVSLVAQLLSTQWDVVGISDGDRKRKTVSHTFEHNIAVAQELGPSEQGKYPKLAKKVFLSRYFIHDSCCGS